MITSPTLFRRKTYEVKAIRISAPSDGQAVAEWLGCTVLRQYTTLDSVTRVLTQTDVFIDSNPKPVSVPCGDWLVRNTDGTFTSMPAAVFAEVFEVAPRA